jgi:hypothetical protein
VPFDELPLPAEEIRRTGGKVDPGALRTRLARKFVDLADSVTDAFRDFTIGGGAWGVELTAPEGMSTGGGKQALQHLRLRPRRRGHDVLVGGSVDQVAGSAALRTYEHVAIAHYVRFRRNLDISGQEWEQFLRKAEVVLEGAGLTTTRTAPPPDLVEQRRRMIPISPRATAFFVVVVVLAVIVLWRALAVR